jgi:hypothetical protein
MEVCFICPACGVLAMDQTPPGVEVFTCLKCGARLTMNAAGAVGEVPDEHD